MATNRKYQYSKSRNKYRAMGEPEGKSFDTKEEAINRFDEISKVNPNELINPMKGMNEFEKATFRLATNKDPRYKDSAQAVADSMTVYKKAPQTLSHYMPTLERMKKVDELGSKIAILQAEIDAYPRWERDMIKSGKSINPTTWFAANDTTAHIGDFKSQDDKMKAVKKRLQIDKLRQELEFHKLEDKDPLDLGL